MEQSNTHAPQQSWQINCTDMAGRDRNLTVFASVETACNQVVLMGPPGETAVLSVDQVDQLRTSLHTALETMQLTAASSAER